MTYRQWIEMRVRAVLDAGHGRDLAGRWPQDVPTLKASVEHNETQLEQIDAACTVVESIHRMPFGEPDPRCSVEACEALNASITALGFDRRIRLDWWLDEMADAGHPVPLHPSLYRQFLHAEVLVALADMPIAEAAAFVARAVGGADTSREGDLLGTLSTETLRRIRDAARNAAVLDRDDIRTFQQAN